MTEVWENDDEETHRMQQHGWAAYEADDSELAESWWQKAADRGNLGAIAALEHLRRSN